MIRGDLKVNTLRLQGRGATGTDYSFEVNEDTLHMKMGNASLLTVAPESVEQSMSISDNIKPDHNLQISKNTVFKKNVHVEGSELCLHGKFELKENARYTQYKKYDSERTTYEHTMGMSHMMHMIGGGYFSEVAGGDDEMLIALEFCHKMQPHHQEAVDTGDVMYKWAADGAVGHLGFHLKYWQQIEINTQNVIGLNIISYILNTKLEDGSHKYSQMIRSKVEKLVVDFKRVKYGTGTHTYNKSTDTYDEKEGGEYSKSIDYSQTLSPPTYKKQLKYWPEYMRMMNDEFYVYNYPGPHFLYPDLELNFLRDMLLQNEGGHMMIESMLQNMNTQFHSPEEMATGEYVPGSSNYNFRESVKILDFVDQELNGNLISDEDQLAKHPVSNGLLEIVNREYKIYFGEIPYLKELIQTICTRNRMVAEEIKDSSSHSTDGHSDHNDTTTFTVKSGMANGEHKFLMNGEYKAMIMLKKGSMYKFDQSDVANCGPLGFSTLVDGRVNGIVREENVFDEGVLYYLDGSIVTKDEYKQMFTMHSERYLTFNVPATTPMNLYYFCKNMAHMGGQFHVM